MYLNAHSYYSLRYGTLSIEDLVNMAVAAGHKVMALTDINNVSGIFDFLKACEDAGIKPIAGMEFKNGDAQKYTALALDKEGFMEMNEFSSRYLLSHEPFPDRAPAFRKLIIIYPFGHLQGHRLWENEYIGVPISMLNRLINYSLKERERMVFFQPLTFAAPEDYELHRVLRAIDHNSMAGHLRPEAFAAADEYLLSIDGLKMACSGYPELWANAERISERCSFGVDRKTVKNKKTFTGTHYDDRLLLEKLALEGMVYRYGRSNPEARRRVMHELDVITRLGFLSYFLITWDVIRYSMSRGFYHVGRGSGANSIVAYCLRITDVDPIELDLYFERFINPARTSPPDFDIDYSWNDRDDVIDYLFKRYGRKHTALIATISTFKGKSIVRELGKVHGLPKAEIDALVANPPAEKDCDEVALDIFNTGKRIADFPNLRSIHAGGVLISEEPIFAYTALDMPPKGFQTTQFDMYIAEAIGFEKLDILSQRGIGHIQDSVSIIYENTGKRIDVHDIPAFKKDPVIKEQLQRGDTIGCFYVESPAMRGLLKKLRCDNYISLVAASSIIRPGVAKSGMMRAYIERFHRPDSFSYLHPVMEKLLQETYGVMVYQEDVIKVAHHFAGLDLSEADVLRRAMSGKFRGRAEFDRIVEKFFKNCQERGYPETLAKEVWRQIESFSGYSFSKAHSASFAVESYQSLYLKSHYPLEFMTAVINNFGGFYSTWVYVNEARLAGAKIENPCVNTSNYLTRIKGHVIWLGFVHVENLESSLAKNIVEEREQNGPYQSMFDFVTRTGASRDQLIILARIGALRFSGQSKKELLWEAHLHSGNNQKVEEGITLFRSSPKQFTLPELVHTGFEDVFDEMELLGFPVSCTHFDLLKTNWRGGILTAEMPSRIGQTVRVLGNLVTRKYVTTVRKELMIFGTWFDMEGKFFDTTHFPPSLAKYPFSGNGIYLIEAKVVEEFGFPSLEVSRMAKLPFVPDPRYAD